MTTSAPTIELELRASHAFRGVLPFIGLLAAAAPWLSAARWPWSAAISLAAVALTAQVWRAHRATHGLRLSVRGDDRASWCSAGGAMRHGVLGEAVVLGPLIGLTLRADAGGRAVRLALWPDSADHHSLRRLRVRLLARPRRLDAPMV